MINEAREVVLFFTKTTLGLECPYCLNMNYIELGDLEDHTAPDADSCQCFNCSRKFWLEGKKEAFIFNLEYVPDSTKETMNFDKDIIEESYWEKGKPTC